VVWHLDRAFLTSRWTCIWGRGCQGILPERTEHLRQGCCSIGADLDEDDAPNLAALTAFIPDELFEHHVEARDGGIFRDASRTGTRIVDGACIFLNRPGFVGGEGCALHLAADDAGESPIDWKPSVCWQLPVRVEWEDQADGTEIATVRGWTRADWGDEGRVMAWCCTEEAEAYVGDGPVFETVGEELEAIVGEDVYVELRRRLSD
jgi:hypothetical protein